MFYSHTFLARKGPLGTVWCAAHLQHKLNKAQYMSTKIPDTVEKIMDPAVPIALRLSGHLLLGVVRIYSKQVEYLCEECNVIRITINRVFTTESVNLPEDATHATFHSVTLPENFDLDALELDDYDKGWDWQNDLHRRSQHEITLEEQIPTGNDPYIIINFEEQQMNLTAAGNLGSGPVPMEEDIPAVEVDRADEFRTSPSTRVGTDDRNVGASSPQELPSIETMRDARHGFDLRNSPILPDRAEPDMFLEEQINKDNETYTLHPEEVPLPGGSVSSPRAHENPPSVGRLDSPMLFEHQSPELQMQPSPPPIARPIARPQVRRRRKFFDETVVLSNEFIQRELDDTSNICRVRKECPSSSLSIWKRNVKMRLMKDDHFVQPYASGACADLQDIYKEDAVSVKFHPVFADELRQETAAGEPSGTRPVDEEEIEVLRNNEYASPDRHMPDISVILPSPSERGYSTPLNSNVGLQSEFIKPTEGDEVLLTAGTRASSGMPDSDIGTPDTFYATGLQGDHTALSDIPELVASPGELGFLEQGNSPAGSPESPSARKGEETSNHKALSSRTRCVAQYLKRQSSASADAESSDYLSLNKILEGKTRKICARMFYESLVLKSNEFIDLHQEAPYGDITLKMTYKLFAEEFSS